MGCFAGSLLDVVLIESGSLVSEGSGGGSSSDGECNDGFTTQEGSSGDGSDGCFCGFHWRTSQSIE